MSCSLLWSALVLVTIGCSSCAPAFLSRAPVLPDAYRDDPRYQQVVQVRSVNAGFRAFLTAWSRDDAGWRRILGPWPVVVGRNGFALPDQKKEGDGKTPSGVYPVLLAFGRQAAIETGLKYRQTHADDIWVDDPGSVQYNRWIQDKSDASSWEKMLRPDGLYDLGAVIEYNTDPVVPGKGSAIFLHIWRDIGHKPTAGCVAMGQRRLRQLLAWLNTERFPLISLGAENFPNSSKP